MGADSLVQARTENTEIAQSIDVLPVRGRSRKSRIRPSHGGNRGSNPLGDAKKIKDLGTRGDTSLVSPIFFQSAWHLALRSINPYVFCKAATLWG
jgi:hypothetical protein